MKRLSVFITALASLIFLAAAPSVSSSGSEPNALHPGHLRLKHAFDRYTAIKSRGVWPVVPEGPLLKRGSKGKRVNLLRERLSASVDFSRGPSDGVFNAALDTAVRNFQKRHGLIVDGIVGPETLGALNVPVDRRIRQIELNLKRWQWLPEKYANRYVLVNIADFKLEVFEDGQLVLDMRVVVGRPQWDTPVFSARMAKLVLNPYWFVPRSIAIKELLPIVQNDPAYLGRSDFVVLEGEEEIEDSAIDWSELEQEGFPYVLRQEPGPSNPMGRIKFVFPNPYNIYIHDTPSSKLFTENSRAFSHSCIRAEKPVELAEYLLRDDPGWSREGILYAIDAGTPQIVNLPDPIDVHVVYWTSWADANGQVNFRNDLYGRDALLEEEIFDEEE